MAHGGAYAVDRRSVALMSTACATTPPAAKAMFEGRWNSTPSRAGNERKDECVFERNGKFYCMSTFCSSGTGANVRFRPIADVRVEPPKEGIR